MLVFWNLQLFERKLLPFVTIVRLAISFMASLRNHVWQWRTWWWRKKDLGLRFHGGGWRIVNWAWTIRIGRSTIEDNIMPYPHFIYTYFWSSFELLILQVFPCLSSSLIYLPQMPDCPGYPLSVWHSMGLNTTDANTVIPSVHTIIRKSCVGWWSHNCLGMIKL